VVSKTVIERVTRSLKF